MSMATALSLGVSSKVGGATFSITNSIAVLNGINTRRAINIRNGGRLWSNSRSKRLLDRWWPLSLTSLTVSMGKTVLWNSYLLSRNQ